MTPFGCVADLARNQHRTIHLNQLRRHLNREQLRHLVRTGRLWPRFPGVYALEGPLEPIGDLHAAVLYGGDRSMSTLFSAAVLQRIGPAWPLKPQLVIASDTGSRGPDGLDLHHTRTLLARDVTEVDGIRTTAVPRTIIDCSRHLDAPAIKRMLREAEFQHGTDLTLLDRPRIPKLLRAALRLYVLGSGLTASELEARFLDLVAALPSPSVQRFEGRFRVDFVWPDARLVVETDGRGAHDRSVAFLEDRRRDRELQLRGWIVLRYTWAEVVNESARVLEELRRALSQSAAGGAPRRRHG